MGNGVSDRGLRAALRPIGDKLMMMAAKAVVRLVNDAGTRQVMQLEILKDELRDGVERFQNYGFNSHPLPGAEAVISCPNGTRERAVVVVVDDRRYHLVLQPGEAAMFTHEGDWVKLGANRHITVMTEKVDIDSVGGVSISDSLETGGNVKVGTGATGTLTDTTGKVATFQDGICINII